MSDCPNGEAIGEKLIQHYGKGLTTLQKEKLAAVVKSIIPRECSLRKSDVPELASQVVAALGAGGLIEVLQRERRMESIPVVFREYEELPPEIREKMD